MSYDVTVGNEHFNCTANLSRFFSVFGVHPVAHMNNQPASVVADRIDSALEALAGFDMDTLREKWDAENKWGTVPSAIDFLTRVRDACRANPIATVTGEF